MGLKPFMSESFEEIRSDLIYEMYAGFPCWDAQRVFGVSERASEAVLGPGGLSAGAGQRLQHDCGLCNWAKRERVSGSSGIFRVVQGKQPASPHLFEGGCTVGARKRKGQA